MVTRHSVTVPAFGVADRLLFGAAERFPVLFRPNAHRCVSSLARADRSSAAASTARSFTELAFCPFGMRRGRRLD